MERTFFNNLFLSILFILFFGVSSPLEAKLRIVTTTSDLKALTAAVGGDLIELESLLSGDQDPHYIEPKPSFVRRLNKADLLIHVGLDLEIGWLPTLITQARNSKIQPGESGNLNASIGIQRLELPLGKIDRSRGDIHPMGNPHYWLNPHNGLLVAKQIANRLSQLDPSHANQFKKRLQVFEKALHLKITDWEQAIHSLRGKKVVTHHKSFSYFVNWSGLEVVGLIEPKPGIPPSPAHVLSLLKLMQREKIRVIVTESFYDTRPSKKVAAKTGAQVIVLPTSVGGQPKILDYFDLFDYIIGQLTQTL